MTLVERTNIAIVALVLTSHAIFSCRDITRFVDKDQDCIKHVMDNVEILNG